MESRVRHQLIVIKETAQDFYRATKDDSIFHGSVFHGNKRRLEPGRNGYVTLMRRMMRYGDLFRDEIGEVGKTGGSMVYPAVRMPRVKLLDQEAAKKVVSTIWRLEIAMDYDREYDQHYLRSSDSGTEVLSMMRELPEIFEREEMEWVKGAIKNAEDAEEETRIDARFDYEDKD